MFEIAAMISIAKRSRSGLTMPLAVQAWRGNLSGNELTRILSGNIRPQSSQLAEPIWTDPCIKSGISVRVANLHFKKKKKKKKERKRKRRRGMNGRTFSKNPGARGKKHHHHDFTFNLESWFRRWWSAASGVPDAKCHSWLDACHDPHPSPFFFKSMIFLGRRKNIPRSTNIKEAAVCNKQVRTLDGVLCVWSR